MFSNLIAPVADVSTDPSSFIYYRTLGQDAETTARYVESTVQTMRDAGIGCALKHVPGYGNNGEDKTNGAKVNKNHHQLRPDISTNTQLL